MSATNQTSLATTGQGQNTKTGGVVTVVILGKPAEKVPFHDGLTAGAAAEEVGGSVGDMRVNEQDASPNQLLQPGDEVMLMEQQAGG